MRRPLVLGAATLSIIALAACSGLLGLTDPGTFPPEGGASSGASTSGTAHADGSLGDDDDDDSAVCAGADLMGDARNCGRCRHDCGAGQCAKGSCQPFELDVLPGMVLGLAVDGSNVYADIYDRGGKGTFYRVSKADRTAAKVVDGDVGNIAADALHLFYELREPDAPDGTPRAGIHICDLVGCLHDLEISRAAQVMSFAPATGFGGTADIAWLDAYRGVLATPSSDLAISKKLAQLNGSDRMRLHAVADRLCYTDTNMTVGCLTRGKDVPTTWATNPVQVSDFALDGDDLVFTSAGALWRGRLGATSLVETKKLATAPGLDAVIRDGDTLYVQGTDAIYTCNVDDCAKPQVLAAKPAQSDGGKPAIITMIADGATIWYGTVDGEIFGVVR